MSDLAEKLANDPVRKLQTIRGRELASQELLQDGLAALRPEWDHGFHLGPLCLPIEDSVKHVCFVGSPGSGKTVLMRLMMQSVLPLVNQSWKGAVPKKEALKRLSSAMAAPAPPPASPPFTPPPTSSTPPKTTPATPQLLTEAEKKKAARVYVSIAIGAMFAFSLPTAFNAVGGFIGVCGLPIVQLLTKVSYSLRGKNVPPFRLERKGRAALWSLLGIPIAIFIGVPLAGSFGPAFLMPLLVSSIFLKVGREEEELPAPAVVVTPPAPQPTPAPSPQASVEIAPYTGPTVWPKHRALIYDAKQEVLPQLAGMGLAGEVVSLNPFDSRSVAWDMASDIIEPATAKQIAAIFIPEEKNASQPFFSDAARHLLEGVMVSFILSRPGDWTFRDVLVTLKSTERLKAVLKMRPETADLVETYLSHDRESKSIAATLATKLGPFDVVAALWEASSRRISLRDWLDGEYILVLGNDESYRTSLDVINRVIFKRVVELLLAKRATSDGRTWFFLDEVKEAGSLDGLGRLMTKGRSVGASVVLGFQDIDGMYEAFGENQARSILGQCATKVILRLDSPETAKWAESVFGEYEGVEIKQSATEGESSSTGETTTKGTTTTEGTSTSDTDGSSSSNNIGSGSTSGKNRSSTTGTSNSTATSDSTANSTTSGTNKSNSLSAELTKRNLILASQFLSLPMTRPDTGIHGFIAHYAGATSFVSRDFVGQLRPEDTTCPHVMPRQSGLQFLQPWSVAELQAKAGISPPSPAPPTPPSPAGQAPTPPSTSKPSKYPAPTPATPAQQASFSAIFQTYGK